METTPPLTERVLVPLDGSALSEQAIPYALSLVAPGGKITSFRAIPEPEPIFDPLGGVLVGGDEVLRRYRIVAGKEMAETLNRWRTTAAGVSIDVSITVGDPAEEIMRAAREIGAGMIVMASKGRGSFGRLAMGSVADRVARTAEVPVLIVRARDAVVELGRAPIRRLIVPLDGSAVSRRALPVAEALARSLHAPVNLLTVIDQFQIESPILLYGAAFSQEIYAEVMGAVDIEAQQMLESVGAQFMARGVPTGWRVLTGPVAGAIIDETNPGDLVVLTSHGRRGLTRWFLGSVAEKLVRDSNGPVLIVPVSAPVLESGGVEASAAVASTPFAA